ncbi:MAG: LptF/LptG family permease [Thermodesulfobacteriota bacterium]
MADMPLLLLTYLITEILAPFFASLIILNAVLFLGRLVPLLDIIFDFGVGLGDFVRLCAYLMPKLLLFSIPMASMMGAIIAITRMVNDNEIMALKANGVGLYRMLPAVGLIALCSATLTLFTAVFLLPQGTIATKQLFFQVAKERIDRGIQEKQFSEGIKEVVLYAEHVDSRTGVWQGVYVSDLRDPKTPVTVMAQNGSLTADAATMQITLRLGEGSLHRALGPKTQTMHFRSYTLSLPMQAPTAMAGDSLTRVGKSGMGLRELRAAAAKSDTTRQERAGYLIEFHQRLALPVGCLILTVLGLPLTLVGRPRHRSIGVPLGLLVFILYYVLLTAAKGFAEENLLPAGLLLWLPNLLFATLTFLFVRQVANETTPLYDRLVEIGGSLIERLPWKRRQVAP